MHSPSLLVSFGLLASLAGVVIGATPATLYRGDSRSSKTIKDAGGFKAKGYDRPEGTLFEHVEGTLKYPSRDPFISTSDDIDVSKGHAGSGNLYFIDSSKITEEIFDVAAEYEKAKRTYGHADEREFSVKKMIPWEAITKIQKKNKDGEWKNIKMPTAETVEGVEEFEEEKPSKGWALSIAMMSMVASHSGWAEISNTWRFYTTPVGKAVGSCGETDGQELTPSVSMDSNADVTNPPWPAGVFDLTIEGEKCQYKCDGTNAGRLFCPNRQISCVGDDAKGSPEGKKMCGSRVSFHAVVYCDF
ncbi:hypothetical protein ACN47E_003132 [Coniothyrium glycines]